MVLGAREMQKEITFFQKYHVILEEVTLIVFWNIGSILEANKNDELSSLYRLWK